MGVDNNNGSTRNTGSFFATIWLFADTESIRRGSTLSTAKGSSSLLEEMVSLIPYGRSRPNIPEYPEIAEHVTQAIQQVYNGSASPEDALNTAASKSADSLGWNGVARAHVHRESD